MPDTYEGLLVYKSKVKDVATAAGVLTYPYNNKKAIEAQGKNYLHHLNGNFNTEWA